MTALRFMIALLLTTTALAEQPGSRDLPVDVAKPIALLQRSGVRWYDKQTCTSCHQQDVPMMTLRLAQERGIPVDKALQRQLVAKAYGFLASLDRAVQHTHLIDPSMDYGMHLVGAHDAGVPASLSTAVYARFIANRQKPDGRWITIDERPPQSHSVFTATAIAMRAVQLYMPSSLQAEMRERVGRAKKWLESTEPSTTEDRVFQLRGLAWAGADPALLKNLAGRLVALQRADGGWSQLPRLQSDAYATGEVLVALREAARIPASDAAWQKGARYLRTTQRPDGSWLVRSRMHEQQLVSPPYFESGFPYGANQMISCLGTSWATAALLLSTDPLSPPPAREIDTTAVAANGKPWMETALFGTSGELKTLLDGGLDPNSRTDEGTTLLMMAAHDAAKVRLLVERGAKVNARANSGFTALMVAANVTGATESVRVLLNKGADVRTSDPAPMFNASAIVYSVLSGDTDKLDLLAATSADLRQKMTLVGLAPVRPLDIAVGQRDVPMVRALARKGINVNDDDAEVPLPPLSLAVMANDLPTAQALIDLGADVNKVDAVGSTPLHHAVSVDFGDSDMVSLLLKAGARPETRTKTQGTAQEIAERYGHADFVRLLATRK